MTVAITLFQFSVKSLTEAKATETQILAGDASATVASVKEESVMPIKVMTINIDS